MKLQSINRCLDKSTKNRHTIYILKLNQKPKIPDQWAKVKSNKTRLNWKCICKAIKTFQKIQEKQYQKMCSR